MGNFTINKKNIRDLAKEANIIATNDSHSNSKNLIDGNFLTYWTSPKCNALTSYIELKFNNEEEFNTVEIQEYTPLGENVNEFDIYAYKKRQEDLRHSCLLFLYSDIFIFRLYVCLDLQSHNLNLLNQTYLPVSLSLMFPQNYLMLHLSLHFFAHSSCGEVQ